MNSTRRTQEELEQRLNKLRQLEQEYENELEKIKEQERIQDILYSIAEKADLDPDKHFTDTSQPSNQRLNKDGFKKVDDTLSNLMQTVKDKDKRIQQLLDKVDNK
jgi:ABC-type transporter Mla subunit MlaD